MQEVRIASDACFMMDIISDVRKGHAVPAAFQRPFVWTARDVEALWTSILRGYPLGSFLLWRPDDAQAYGRSTLGPIPLSPGKGSTLILDGQNRLTAIAWSMTAPDEIVPENAPGKDIFRSEKILVLDPYQKCARFVEPGEVERMMMPIHYLFTNQNAFFRQGWKDETDNDAMNWLDRAGDKLRGARVVRVTIEDANIEEAREAFLHISRAGVPMSQEDFDKAIQFSPN